VFILRKGMVSIIVNGEKVTKKSNGENHIRPRFCFVRLILNHCAACVLQAL
jgi:hypothetical protein